MSLLLPDSSIASTNLQIWNNAAFDDGGSPSKAASPPLQPVSTNICDPPDLDPDPAKENRSPASNKTAPLPTKKFSARIASRVDDKKFSARIASARNNLQQNKEKTVEVDKLMKRSSSMSPISKQTSVAKASETKKLTSGRAEKSTMEVHSSGKIGSKALFPDGENEVSYKKPSKIPKMRVVASRYSLPGTKGAGVEPGSKRRKWSLSELNREKTRLSLTWSSGSTLDCMESQASELDDQLNLDLQTPSNLNVEANLPSVAPSSPSIMKVTETLPMIKIMRPNFESPRDSGCAKRAADLVGKKSFFAVAASEDLNSPCQGA